MQVDKVWTPFHLKFIQSWKVAVRMLLLMIEVAIDLFIFAL